MKDCQTFFTWFPAGARYMLLSALAFALMGVFVKLAGQQGIPVLEIIAARAAISLVLSYLQVRRRNLSPWGNRKDLLLMRGLVGFLSLTAVYYALVHLPFAEATVLQYLHPMFTALLALLLLSERPTRATVLCIGLSFVGLIIMVRPGSFFGSALEGQLNSVAVMIGVAGAFGSGLAYTLVRKLSATEDAAVIVFYFPLVCLPATLLLLGDGAVMPSPAGWLILLMVGLCTQIGQLALTQAMRLETASRAVSFSYSQVVFAMVLGILVFDEIPVFWTYIGATLIVMGALVNLLWRGPQRPVNTKAGEMPPR